MALYLPIVDGFWSQLLNHLWQATLFALLLLALAALLRGAPARLRYGLYLLASLKFLLPSALLLAALEPLHLAPEGGLVARLASALDFQALMTRVESWLGLCPTDGAGLPPDSRRVLMMVLLAGLWAGGSLLLLISWRRRQRHFAASLEAATEVAGGPLAATFEQLCQRLDVRRPVRLVLAPGVAEPGVWGVWRPVVVLPASMPELLSPAELETVLLHELVHVRRWDNLAASLHMLLCGLLWFHPLIWWLDRRLLAERERACDDRVLQLAGSGELYARSLVKVLRFGVGLPLAGASAATGADLRRRLEHIRSGRRSDAVAYRLVLPAALLVLLLVSLVPAPMASMASTVAFAPRMATTAPAESDAGGAHTGGRKCSKRKQPKEGRCSGRSESPAVPEPGPADPVHQPG